MLVGLTYHHSVSEQVVTSSFSVDQFIKNFFLNSLTLFTFLYFGSEKRKQTSGNFSDLIWGLFITSALLYFGLFSTKQLAILLHNSLVIESKLYLDLIYHFNIALVAVFTSKAFFSFKRMILYQKSANLLKAWKLFEFAILSLLFFNFFPLDYFKPFNFIFIGVVSLGGLILSLNMKWVAYLNFKQKWKNILLLIIILLISASFLEYIYNQPEQQQAHVVNTYDHHDLYNDLGEKAFVIGIFIFIVFYCISSILVILFNLPTSSVFEQKIGEVFNIQKLSETIQLTNDESEIYASLLDTSITTSFADAAWLEVIDNNGRYIEFINYQVDKVDVFELKKAFKKSGIKNQEDLIYVKDLKKQKHFISQGFQFQSVVAIPLYSSSKFLGTLGLLKEVKDGFDKEAIDIAQTLSQQASTAMVNSRLLVDAIENERYQKEIKIAKEVKKKLLDNRNVETTAFDIHSFTKSADEVGGDFYSTGVLSQGRYYIVIADISGHGTSAAFNMAQLKGVFQALIPLGLTIEQFLTQANTALSHCLEKTSFLTLTLMFIDTNTKEIEIGRAGHCPTLYYSSEVIETQYIKNKGLGLGILRNDKYSQHIETYSRKYSSNDAILLFTDGLVEAKNKVGDEYGYKNVLNHAENVMGLSPVEIVESSVQSMYEFCEGVVPDDDITCLCVKFN